MDNVNTKKETKFFRCKVCGMFLNKDKYIPSDRMQIRHNKSAKYLNDSLYIYNRYVISTENISTQFNVGCFFCGNVKN